MNRLQVLLVISLCVTACFGDQITQSIDPDTGDTLVAGTFSSYYYSDQGEYYDGGDFAALVKQQNDGTYSVKGEYQSNLQIQIYQTGLQKTIYQNKISDVQYFQFTKKRDPALIGQNYTQSEVLPNLSAKRSDTLQRLILSFLRQGDKSQQILTGLNQLLKGNQQGQQYSQK